MWPNRVLNRRPLVLESDALQTALGSPAKWYKNEELSCEAYLTCEICVQKASDICEKFAEYFFSGKVTQYTFKESNLAFSVCLSPRNEFAPVKQILSFKNMARLFKALLA